MSVLVKMPYCWKSRVTAQIPCCNFRLKIHLDDTAGATVNEPVHVISNNVAF